MARARSLRIDVSDAIPDETIGVLRDKFGWDGYRLHCARLKLLKFLNRVEPNQLVSVTDDPDDNRVLECAITAGSDFIITQDKDLLWLGEYQGIKIVRIAEFLNRGMHR